MKMYKVTTTAETYFVSAKEEWDARDKVADYMKNEVQGPKVHTITDIELVASIVRGRSTAILIL